MSGILVNQCKTLLLDQRLSHSPFDNLVVGLFTGPTIPTVATVLGDLTEVTGTGYARQTVATWTSSILLANNHAFSQAAQVTFGPAGAGDWTQATGWFWFAPGAAKLVMADRFLVAWTLPNGAIYPWVPFFVLTGE